jgi:outer membrane protein
MSLYLPPFKVKGSRVEVRAFQLLLIVIFILVLDLRAQEQDSVLTLSQAHEMALKNHPRIKVGDLLALAARQVTREARSGFFPSISGNVVAVGTLHENTRLAAVGALNNPSILERNAEGLLASQLITDFGRTANLTRGAEARAEAAVKNAEATREQILLEVDSSFFAALQAQAVTKVAQQTIATRQLLLNRVTTLASNRMKSELDVSFARVNLDAGNLLLSRAQNDLEGAFSALSAVVGLNEPRTWRLVEEPVPPDVSTNASEFVEQALRMRPDLVRFRYEREAASRFAKAERAARYPTIAAVGAAGVVPIRDSQLPDNYAAAGLTLNLPLFAGGLYAARQKEAELRASAADESVRDAENNAIRDVRIAWLNARNAYDRLGITRQLVENAKRVFDLAKARYDVGSSSIVELNQAQLDEISAEIEYENTKYEYLLRLSALNFQTGSLR